MTHRNSSGSWLARRAALAGLVVLIATSIVLGALHVRSAHGGQPPYLAVPAVSNMATLAKEATVVAAQAQMSHVPDDLRPTGATAVHTAGPNGFVWIHGSQVCSLFDNQTGGCLDSFTKPVSLYLFGDKTGFTVAGTVPDEVKALVLHTSIGDLIVSIENNGFSKRVPANTSISGEVVTLANGSTFTSDDPVQLPTS